MSPGKLIQNFAFSLGHFWRKTIAIPLFRQLEIVVVKAQKCAFCLQIPVVKAFRQNLKTCRQTEVHFAESDRTTANANPVYHQVQFREIWVKNG